MFLASTAMRPLFRVWKQSSSNNCFNRPISIVFQRYIAIHMDAREHIYFQNRAAWREWLSTNGTQNEAIWLVYDKGKKGNDALNYSAIVEEALCFGWIDSKPGKVDDKQTKIYMSPRKPKSMWSQLNKQRVEELRAAKKMTPAGEKAISMAQSNGSWDILNDSDALIIAPDLGAALAADPVAERHFTAFSASAKRGILYWIYSARRSVTRAQRIAVTVARAAENQRSRWVEPWTILMRVEYWNADSAVIRDDWNKEL